MELGLWLARRRMRADQALLTKRGVWGNTPETLELLFEYLTPERLASIDLLTLKTTKLRTRSSNVDLLIQLVERARWILQDQENVIDEPIRKLSDFDRTLDDYLLTVNETPIRPEEVVPRLQEELVTFVDHYQLMVAEGNERVDYYRRQYEWLFVELRELLQALARGVDPKLTF